MPEETQNAETAPETADGTDTPGQADLSAALDLLAAERDRIETEKAALNDLLLRRTAEFDNYRKRTEREKASLIEYAASDSVKALLPILDDFERALAQTGASEEYARGVELILQRMKEALGKLGLEPIDAEGKPFDPNLHHAIEMVRCDDQEDHTVLCDLLRGYMFKGRLLRPSMVRVAVKK